MFRPKLCFRATYAAVMVAWTSAVGSVPILQLPRSDGRRGEKHEGGQGGDQRAHLISLSTFCCFVAPVEWPRQTPACCELGDGALATVLY